MTATRDDESDRTDRPPEDPGSADDDEPTVVFEFGVPTDAFILEMALGRFPDVTVEFERFTPTNSRSLPYLWVTDGSTPEFGEAIANDPQVARVRTVTAFDEGTLYRVDWTPQEDELLHWFTNNDIDAVLLQSRGRDGEWSLKVRFPSRAKLAEFWAYLRNENVDHRVIHLHDLTSPKLGQYDITRKQREALVRAVELGYFEIPREATLEEVATALGISSKSASERLRRGHKNLVGSTLSIGQLTGIGLSSD